MGRVSLRAALVTTLWCFGGVGGRAFWSPAADAHLDFASRDGSSSSSLVVHAAESVTAVYEEAIKASRSCGILISALLYTMYVQQQ